MTDLEQYARLAEDVAKPDFLKRYAALHKAIEAYVAVKVIMSNDYIQKRADVIWAAHDLCRGSDAKSL